VHYGLVIKGHNDLCEVGRSSTKWQCIAIATFCSLHFMPQNEIQYLLMLSSVISRHNPHKTCDTIACRAGRSLDGRKMQKRQQRRVTAKTITQYHINNSVRQQIAVAESKILTSSFSRRFRGHRTLSLTTALEVCLHTLNVETRRDLHAQRHAAVHIACLAIEH